MNADLYTKIILTIIAFCLVAQLLQSNFIPKTQAENVPAKPVIPAGTGEC